LHKGQDDLVKKLKIDPALVKQAKAALAE